MGSDRLTYLFRRYVDNRCTESERAEFLKLAGNPRHAGQLAALMDALWKEVPGRKLDADKSQRILTEILQRDPAVIPLHGRRSFPWVKIAASIILAVVCGGALFYFNERPAEGAAVAESAPVQEGFIRLPDGSTVILNAGSKLEYPKAFDGAVREVSLIGEAFFDIAHDEKRPFIVQTGKLKTTVLGTAFNIRAYPDQGDITVTVTRGKVKVSDDKKVLGIINPDQQLTFNTTFESAEHRTVDSHSVTAWMEKDIFFDDITVAQALDQLEKRFHVTVRLTNENLGACRLTATFVKGEDIGQILRILSDFNNATLVERGAAEFVIEGGTCPL